MFDRLPGFESAERHSVFFLESAQKLRALQARYLSTIELRQSFEWFLPDPCRDSRRALRPIGQFLNQMRILPAHRVEAIQDVVDQSRRFTVAEPCQIRRFSMALHQGIRSFRILEKEKQTATTVEIYGVIYPGGDRDCVAGHGSARRNECHRPIQPYQYARCQVGVRRGIGKLSLKEANLPVVLEANVSGFDGHLNARLSKVISGH